MAGERELRLDVVRRLVARDKIGWACSSTGLDEDSVRAFVEAAGGASKAPFAALGLALWERDESAIFSHAPRTGVFGAYVTTFWCCLAGGDFDGAARWAAALDVLDC